MKTNFTTVLVAAVAINLHAAGAVIPPNRPVSKRSTVIMSHSFVKKPVRTFDDIQPPIISFSTPHSYGVGEIITPIPLINTGGDIPYGSYGEVETFAGNGTAGSGEGSALSASFNHPYSCTIDNNSMIYIADAGNNKIRTLRNGTVATYSGTGVAGSADGVLASATFNMPTAIAISPTDPYIYVVDAGNNKIRRIKTSTGGLVTTLAGSGAAGSANGTGSAASFNSPYGIVCDKSGNIYISDFGNNKIRKMTALGVVTDFAGAGTHGFTNGTGAAAHFDGPRGISIDDAGNLYVADSQNNAIRKITPAGVVTTLAGHLTAGSADGTGANARFNTPYSTTVDPLGNVYVADGANNLIRRITPSGVVTTLAGSTAGAANGVGAAAKFNLPTGVAYGPDNQLYVTEYNNNDIRNVDVFGTQIVTSLPPGLMFSLSEDFEMTINGTPTVPALTTNFTVKVYNSGGSNSTAQTIRVNSVSAANITYPAATFSYNAGTPVSPVIPVNSGGSIPSVAYAQTNTLAGSGAAGSGNGTGTAATFNHPSATVTDAAGNVYVADGTNNLIRKITPAGLVTTFAGSGAAGFADGTGTAAIFNNPTGITIDSGGNLYVADNGNNRIREITPAKVVTTMAGSGAVGAANGTGTAASFNAPYGVAADASGNIFVSEFGNCKIRKITPAGVVTDLAGAGTHGFTNGTGAAVRFNSPMGLSADMSGNLYVADSKNNAIRKVTPAGVVTTLAGHAAAGNTNGTGTTAAFDMPYGTAVDAAGNIFVADANNNLIRKITPAGVVTTFAGNAAGATNGIGTAASFNLPAGICGDLYGNIYVAEYTNNTIRKISATGYSVAPALPAGLTLNPATGIITGTPTANTSSANYVITGYSAGGGNAVTIKIAVSNPVTAAPHIRYSPTTITFNAGTAITPLKPINAGGPVPAVAYGRLTHIAGNIAPGSTNGTGAAATFNSPSALVTDAMGNIYVSDAGNRLIRKISPAGVVTTIAGPAISGISLSNSHGITADALGNLYVSEISTNSRIFKVAPDGTGTVYTGGVTGNADGQVPNATFNKPYGMVTDAQGNIFVADGLNATIRQITPAGVVSHVAVSGLQLPQGITIDPSANLFVFDNQVKTVFKIIGGAATGFAFNGDVSGGGVAADRAGNIYTSGATAINKFGSAGGAATPIANVKASALTTDAAGSLYAIVGNSIDKIETQGYAVSPALPAGLVFDPATGIISGVPEAGAVAKNYTVTAYNSVGSSATMINITVNPPAAPNFSLPDNNYNFSLGVPITPIPVTNSGGPVVPAYPANNQTFFVGNVNDGSTNGTGASASFKGIIDMALDASGNLYIADAGNNLIRKSTPAGVVTTFAGSGSAGSVDGIANGASFNNIVGVAVDKPSGTVYVADQGNHKIRKITEDGVVTTLAGSGASGTTNGTGAAATFAMLKGICVDRDGNIFVVDGDAIRQITPAGVVTTFNDTSFHGAIDIAADASGNLYIPTPTVTDDDFHEDLVSIFKVTPDGHIIDIFDFIDFQLRIKSITCDPYGNVYTTGVFEDGGRVHKFTSDGVSVIDFIYIGVLTSIAADGSGTFYGSISPLNSSGDEVPALPANTIIKIYGNGSDYLSQMVAGLTFNTTAGTITGAPEYTGTQNYYFVGGYNAFGSNKFRFSATVTEAPPAINYMGSPYNFQTGAAITPITPINAGGAIPSDQAYGKATLFAGSGTDGKVQGKGAAASFNGISGMTLKGDGLYITETGNQDIRTSSWFVHQTSYPDDGTIRVEAGSGVAGSTDGPVLSARFNNPVGIAGSYAPGNAEYYVADKDSHKIRYRGYQGSTDYIFTLAGSGTTGSSDGTGAGATFNELRAITNEQAVNHCVYVLDPALRKITYDGVVTTLVTADNFQNPVALTVDLLGNIYVADAGNGTIYKVTPAGVISPFVTFADGDHQITSIDGKNAFGNIYTTEYYAGKGRINKITPDGHITSVIVKTPISALASVGDGNVYVASVALSYNGSPVPPPAPNTILKINTNGYTISPALPAGFTFDSATGIISGTPTAASLVTDYLITGINKVGYSLYTIQLGVTMSPMAMAANLAETPIAGEPVVHQLLSPNGDGNNDVLAIENIDQYPNNKVVIMDVNGGKVYETAGYGTNGKAFDGHSSVTGKMQNPGTYFYQLEYASPTGTKRKAGYFVIKY